MRITELFVENFRNIQKERITFSPSTNLFLGRNAEGKTNIVEAIYYFANSRSFRTSHDSELIKFGENKSKLTAIFVDDGREFKYEIDLNKNEKRSFYYNGIKISKMSEFFGNFRAVLFVPEHLRIVKNGPSERRSLIDGAICQLKKTYISDLFKYTKILGEKNALLKDYKDTLEDKTLLDVYDMSLVEYGAKITKIRREYTEKLFLKAKEHLYNMSGDELSYEFRPSGFSLTDSEEEFYKKLFAESRKRDIIYKSATTGAQRDDFDIKINSLSLRQYGSQGQQRSVVIALKLAEGEIANQIKGSSPIYLFDDILSELDIKRREYILEKLTDKQVIITSCLSDEEKLYSGKTIFVENGKYKEK